jgi:hypothetical protein
MANKSGSSGPEPSKLPAGGDMVGVDPSAIERAWQKHAVAQDS